jgi:hypothetical protein
MNLKKNPCTKTTTTREPICSREVTLVLPKERNSCYIQHRCFQHKIFLIKSNFFHLTVFIKSCIWYNHTVISRILMSVINIPDCDKKVILYILSFDWNEQLLHIIYPFQLHAFCENTNTLCGLLYFYIFYYLHMIFFLNC